MTFVTFGCGLLFLPVLESAFGCDTSHIYNCSYDDANTRIFDNVVITEVETETGSAQALR